MANTAKPGQTVANSGKYSQTVARTRTRTHTTGHHPGPHRVPIPPLPGYHPTHHHGRRPAHWPEHAHSDTLARSKMSVFPKLTPTGCSEKRLSAYNRHDRRRLPDWDRTSQAGSLSQRGVFSTKQWFLVVFGHNEVILAQKWEFLAKMRLFLAKKWEFLAKTVVFGGF